MRRRRRRPVGPLSSGPWRRSPIECIQREEERRETVQVLLGGPRGYPHGCLPRVPHDSCVPERGSRILNVPSLDGPRRRGEEWEVSGVFGQDKGSPGSSGRTLALGYREGSSEGMLASGRMETREKISRVLRTTTRRLRRSPDGVRLRGAEGISPPDPLG